MVALELTTSLRLLVRLSSRYEAVPWVHDLLHGMVDLLILNALRGDTAAPGVTPATKDERPCVSFCSMERVFSPMDVEFETDTSP